MLSLAACYSATRFIHITAIMQGFGIALFCECLTPATLRPYMRARLAGIGRFMAVFSLLTALGILILQAGLMGEGWSDTQRPDIWLAVLHTAFGTVWQWHMLLALLAVIIAGRLPLSPVRHRQLLAVYSGLLISMALVGHSAMYDGIRGGLQRANQMVHLLSAAWWLGCLVPLTVCLPLLSQTTRPDALRALIRFSRSAHFAVALVIVSGSVNTALVLGQWPLDWTSRYQLLLMIKMGVVITMVGIAIANRYAVVPMLRSHPARAIRLLQVLTLTEIVLGGAVLLLVSVFATFEP
ncbi:copper homeostasis membrane protein CopD [Acerihabitans sp. TG2]|uniref:copper homeostasis membrane protein CopD n=1 Tax=Acerihabitans sp. TG2 TaxID=3096008 RepID=UPI002B22946B|nr:copper homeostasis membrane protein CopD [Acerihabitans sp. TG2]MEA9392987.1 copper homeostasis membrane protein CopD [Acerihabitans sp. TG2]